MYILITENDTNFREVLNGKYKITYFSTNTTTNLDVIFFKFNEGKSKINLNGNNNFISDGFLFDTNNITNIFQYIPNKNAEQIVSVERMKTINITFFDKNNVIKVLNDYTLILKKI